MTTRLTIAEYYKLGQPPLPGMPMPSLPSRVNAAGRAKKRQLEGAIKNACIKLLCAWGCDVLSTPSGSAWREYDTKDGEKRRYLIRFGKEGLGDICALSPRGRWIEIETKSASGQLRQEQIRRRN